MVLDEKYSNSIFTQEEIMVTSPAADRPTIDHSAVNRPAEDRPAVVRPAAGRPAAGCSTAMDESELSNENEELLYVTPCNQ